MLWSSSLSSIAAVCRLFWRVIFQHLNFSQVYLNRHVPLLTVSGLLIRFPQRVSCPQTYSKVILNDIRKQKKKQNNCSTFWIIISLFFNFMLIMRRRTSIDICSGSVVLNNCLGHHFWKSCFYFVYLWSLWKSF